MDPQLTELLLMGIVEGENGHSLLPSSKVNNEKVYISTSPIRLHGIPRDNFKLRICLMLYIKQSPSSAVLPLFSKFFHLCFLFSRLLVGSVYVCTERIC